MAIDLEQFHEVFFEESLEGLDLMEQGLLAINGGEQPDAEVINTIFRAAHSIKGGSGTFGFTAIANFTHVLETLLDEARDGTRILSTEAVDLLLQSSDCLRAMVGSLQAGEPIDDSTSGPLVVAFEAMLAGDTVPASEEASTTVPDAAAIPSVDSGLSHNDIVEASINSLLGADDEASLNNDGTSGAGGSDEDGGSSGGGAEWKISFQPDPEILMTGNEPLRLFRELAAMGAMRTEAHTQSIPDFDHLSADECFISWTLWLTADVSRDEIVEVFDWVVDECKLEVELVGDASEELSPVVAEESAQAAESPQEPAASAPVSEPEPVPQPEPAPEPKAAPVATPAATTPAAPATAKESEKAAPATPASSSSSIRVGIDKVDSLINLVGELVITQSMLSELGNNFEMEKLDRLSNGLEQLLQNTKELQESVMRIRMLPISFAFNRFPRMIRDLAQKTGKVVDLQLSGEQTELDKTVMEQIGDPLVHLVRNAIDHGIEPAEERLANGKPEQGTIKLDAYHQGGNIVIEIRDDGRGINPDVILAKAIEKGIVSAGEDLPESRIFDLIFEPGFSTAAVVSDISGRGVGMDVVRRNIKSLGGRIEIQSKLGSGSTFKVYLPLTLAIVDGQLVRVGTETYIVPLISIVESLQIKPELVNRVSGDMALYRLRDDNVPIIPIYREFGIEADNTVLENGLLVVVEGEGQKIGLLVDDLLAQQQVVIKSLVSNYKRVEGVSGATILGDGSVSMILDIAGLIRQVSERSQKRRGRKSGGSGSNSQHQAA